LFLAFFAWGGILGCKSMQPHNKRHRLDQPYNERADDEPGSYRKRPEKAVAQLSPAQHEQRHYKRKGERSSDLSSSPTLDSPLMAGPTHHSSAATFTRRINAPEENQNVNDTLNDVRRMAKQVALARANLKVNPGNGIAVQEQEKQLEITNSDSSNATSKGTAVFEYGKESSTSSSNANHIAMHGIEE